MLPFLRKPAAEIKAKKRYGIIISGPWDYKPNRDYLDYAIEKVFPKIKINTNVLIMGINPGETLRKKIRSYQKEDSAISIEILENVKNYREMVASSEIYFLSIKSGAGSSSKTLDAMEAGIPALVSHFIKEGMDPHGECPGLIACRDENEYAGWINILLANKELCKKNWRCGNDILPEKAKRSSSGLFKNTEMVQ